MHVLSFFISGLMAVLTLHMPTNADPSGVEVAEHIGLHPALLAAGGLNLSEAATMLDRLESASPERNEYYTQQVLADQAIASIATIHAQLQDRPGDATLKAALAEAAQSLAAARQAHAVARAQLVGAVAAGLGDVSAASIESRCACVDAGLPPEYGAALDSDQIRRTVRLAQIAERRAQRRGEPTPDNDGQSLLAQVRQRADVVQAQVWRDLYEDGINALWDQGR